MTGEQDEIITCFFFSCRKCEARGFFFSFLCSKHWKMEREEVYVVTEFFLKVIVVCVMWDEREEETYLLYCVILREKGDGSFFLFIFRVVRLFYVLRMDVSLSFFCKALRDGELIWKSQTSCWMKKRSILLAFFSLIFQVHSVREPTVVLSLGPFFMVLKNKLQSNFVSCLL